MKDLLYQTLQLQISELKAEIIRQQKIVARYRSDFQTLFLQKNKLKAEKDRIRNELRNKKNELENARLNQELTTVWSEKTSKEIRYLQEELDKRDAKLAQIRQKEQTIQKPLEKINKKNLLIIGELARDRESVIKALEQHYRKKYDRDCPWKVTFWSNKDLPGKHISQLEKQHCKYDLLIIGLLHKHKGILGSSNLITDLHTNPTKYIQAILPGKQDKKKKLSIDKLLHKLNKFESNKQQH